MRLGILSDTHDQLDRVRAAVALLRAEGADALVHCGDLTGPAVVEACSLLPLYFVLGNHDADAAPALCQAAADVGAVCLDWGGVVDLGGARVGVTHGHMTYDLRRVQAALPDYLLTGHSHLPHDRRERGIRRINPGALHEADAHTVALLDLDTDDLRLLTVG